MMKSADLSLVASQFIAIDSLVLVGMVQSLNCSVAFGTFQSQGTLIPTYSFAQYFTVFRCVLKDFRRSSEISKVMRVDTTFAIVGVSTFRTPGCFIHEHIENKTVFFQVELLQVVVQVRTVH